MSIVSKPMTQEYADGWDRTFGKKPLEVTFIVNGYNVVHEVLDMHEPLAKVLDLVLEKTGNLGSAIGRWELHVENGPLLDQALSADQLGLTESSRLFLTLRSSGG